MNNNLLPRQDSNQVVLSYELLALLQWMVTNDAPRLKRVISGALKSGLKHHIQHPDLGAGQTPEDAQYGIIEFFGLLESLMIEVINENSVQDALEKNLMPEIDHIDGSVDNETVRSTIEKVSSALSHNPKRNPQEILYKELLRRWKPGNKKELN